MSDEPADKGEWIRAAVETHERALMAYATRILGDVDRARDVVQDTFLKMWQADRGSVEDHLAPWLYRVCRNRAVDELRKDGRMSTLSDKVAATTAAPESARARRSESNEGRDAVLGLLDQLPERQQEVVRLKFQGGLSYREIGTVMDLTVSHVGVILHNAIKTIREQLEAGSQGPASTDPSSNPTVSR